MMIKGKRDGKVYIMCTNNKEKIAAFAAEMDTTEYITPKLGARPSVVVTDDLKATS